MSQNEKDRIDRIVKDYYEHTGSAENDAIARKWLYEHISDPGYDGMFEALLSETAPDGDREYIRQSKARLDRLIFLEEDSERKMHRSRKVFWGINAFVAAASIAVGIFFFARKETVVWTEVYAQRCETRSVDLPDGSSIRLRPDTRVLYPSRFDGDTRTIYIDGEIYADIAKNPKKPFIVSASDMNVQVHGTQFIVKSYPENDNIEVSLLSGSVSMKDTREGRNFCKRLIPGEMVRYNKTDGSFEQYNINLGNYQTIDDNIRFIDQTLDDIAKDLERKFDVDIIIEDENLARRQYYASFINDETIDDILKALNSNGSMKIRRVNKTIVITAR